MGRKNKNAGSRSRGGLGSNMKGTGQFSPEGIMRDLSKMPVVRQTRKPDYLDDSAHIIRKVLGTEEIVSQAPMFASHERIIGGFFLPFFLTVRGGGFSEETASAYIEKIKEPKEIELARGKIIASSRLGNHYLNVPIDRETRQELITERRLVTDQLYGSDRRGLIFPNLRFLQLGMFGSEDSALKAKEMFTDQLPQVLTLDTPEVAVLPRR